MAEDSAFPPDVAVRLAVTNHYGTSIKGGEGCDDAAVSALYLSKVMPGNYFVVRANRPGHVAEPTKLGKGRKGRRIEDQGVFGVSPKEAARFLKRANQGRLAETLQRGLINRDRLADVLRRGRA
jgi:hypothetical protein